MANHRESRWILVVLVSLLLVQSCAGTKDRRSGNGSIQAPDKAPPSAAHHIAAGQYQIAIDQYNLECRKRPEDRALINRYVSSVEEIKTIADKAVDEGQFVSAGRVYIVLLKNYPSFNGFTQLLSFDAAYLNAKLSYCKKSLSAQGFQEYRKGNLAGAIATWESLLAIDPDNTDIKGAVRTAKLQQKNMRESASGQ